MTNPFIPLVELTRNGSSECLHFGAVAVTDLHGRLLAYAGNPHWQCFTRSTLKALQALPFVAGNGPKAFDFESPQLAMLCASHNGEDMHVAQTSTMLRKSGLDYRALRCGCHVPSLYAALDQAPPAGLVYDERHNNCSGKHAGFLAWCVQHGAPLDNYIDPNHPLQRAVRKTVADVARMDEQDLSMGIDGCSAPNYAMPLSRLAMSYARLASGANDPRYGEAFELLSNAMVQHPELVSGTARNDLALTLAGRGDWVCKIGADGVQVIGSKSRQQALAIKIADGSKPALYAATVAVLDQLGWLDAQQREELAPWRAQQLSNARGLHVGERRACFVLAHPL